MMFSSLRRGQCRRWDDFELRKRLRQLSVPRRVSLPILLLLFLLYFLISSLISAPRLSHSQKCLDERLAVWKTLERDYAVAISKHNLGFTGNGFVGMGDDGELRLKASSSRVLSIRGAFYPFVEISVEDSTSFAESHINDYRVGTIITIRCYSIKGQCMCITQRLYAHRRRPHLIMQELQAINPLRDNIKINLSMKVSKRWTHEESGGKHSSYSRLFESDGVHTLAAVSCIRIPQSVTVEEKRNIVLRFPCVINYVSPVSTAESTMNELKLLSDGIIKELAECSSVDRAVLDHEHSSAWQRLNLVTFGISKSLAPNALNADEINATRYVLLSNMRDPSLEIGTSGEQKKAAAALLNKTDMCYTGHSTLLVPSRLWKKSINMNDLIETMDIWLLTLEKRGCSSLLKAGASGFAEAFVLSLLASKFSREHLEVDIDPTDLQREISAKDLAYSPATRITLSTHLNVDNRPYLVISSSSQIFACDAACLDHPLSVGRSKVRIPVKVTKPRTPILYISHNKKHLEQLRGTIHVIEVMDAPAHEHGLIALHKHGHRLGGLPVIFWLMLSALVVVFHLFLFKLVYSEWKKGDTTPYNYYLRQRYLRAH